MIQSGVTILKLPQILANHFGYNGWISIFIFAFIVMVNIYLISQVYRLGRGQSIFVILEQSIPKFILFPLYLGIAGLWGVIGCLVVKQYIVIYQMVAFPTTSPMLFKVIVDFIIFLLVIKGLYNMSKAATIFYWMTTWMFLLLLIFFRDFEWSRLTPFVFQGETQMISGSIDIYCAFLGFELCMLFFPYVEKRNFFKAVYAGNLLTTLSYLAVSLICFGFYSFDQLKRILFPTLDLLSYIRFPFIEHIENLLFGFILLSVLITCSMFIWGSKEMLQRIWPRASVKGLTLCILFLVYIVSWFPQNLSEIEKWLKLLLYAEAGLTFCLPILLIVLLSIRGNRGGEVHA
jgi:spore germination protein (amino acid permease)